MHASVIDIKHSYKSSMHSFFNSFIETCFENKMNGEFFSALQMLLHEFCVE